MACRHQGYRRHCSCAETLASTQETGCPGSLNGPGSSVTLPGPFVFPSPARSERRLASRMLLFRGLERRPVFGLHRAVAARAHALPARHFRCAVSGGTRYAYRPSTSCTPRGSASVVQPSGEKGGLFFSRHYPGLEQQRQLDACAAD
eukprot:365383-Chlamydomonas_euryale.AAC.9